MTPYEFRLKLEGYTTKYWKDWEHTRHISYIIAKAHATKNLPPPTQWMPLPIDKGYKPMTKRDKKARWKYLLGNLKEKKGKGIW